ncbi:hypothetical protein ABIF97_004070 [Bradyrhizobium japonicum]
MGKSLLTVGRWRRRHMAKGVDGLLKDRLPRIKPLTPEKVKLVVHLTLRAKPPNAPRSSMGQYGSGTGHFLQERSADLACAPVEAALGRNLQSLAR